MMFLVAQAPCSHLGIVGRHPLELDRASCVSLRASVVKQRVVAKRATIKKLRMLSD
jgi:hypothetical protein